MDTDVVVVGGGPVGLAAAVAARRAGLDVVVLEPRAGAIDKACGEGLMPGALRLLHELDVDPVGHALAGIDYRTADGGRRAVHRFRHGEGRGVRRTTLHAALAERAAAAGVVVLPRRVDDVRQDARSVRAGDVSGRWLLACDGLHSTVRRAMGLQARATSSPSRRRFGLRRHYRVAPWSDLVEVHWSGTAEAYVTPVTEDMVGVALLGPRGSRWSPTQFPDLAGRLGGAEPAGPERGAGPLRQTTSRRSCGRVRLVGDAAGYVDALTGEGLRVGLAQAVAAVATLDDPDGYERAWREATRGYRVLTTALVAAASSPARGAVVPLAQRAPWLYGAVVERLSR